MLLDVKEQLRMLIFVVEIFPREALKKRMISPLRLVFEVNSEFSKETVGESKYTMGMRSEEEEAELEIE